MSTMILLWILVILTSISTILDVASGLGLLPKPISDFIAHRRAAPTLRVLRDLGFDIEAVRRSNRASMILPTSGDPDYRASARRLLEQAVVAHSVEIGKLAPRKYNKFIDLMGATTSQTTSRRFAQLLSAYVRELVQDGSLEHFDFVAAPKAGSPVLAYEFASLVRRPLLLHPPEPKFHSSEPLLHASFDFAGDPPRTGAVALLVDDSTTGGRKMVDLIDTLEHFGFQARDCIVVFEPSGKGARRLLQQRGVRLHALAEGPTPEGGE